MNTKRILWAAAVALAVLTVVAFAQQPSPAYYQPVPAPAPPTYYAPQPIYAPAPAQPVYYAPQPATVYAAEEEEEEEGYYWFWGQKWPGLALGPKFGTTGLGLEMTFGVNPYLNLRSGFNYGSFTWGQEFGNVDYDADVTMTSVPLLLDVHPFGGQFRITGGLYLQPGTKADLDATPSEPTQIGSHTYNPDTIGTLTGEIEVSSALTPYLGIGFGNTVGEDQLLTLTLDIGVIFQSYDVSLDSDGAGMTAQLDTFREDLKKEEGLLQKDADDWKIFPVVAISLAWHF